MDGAATLPGDSKAAGFAWASALCLTAACGLLLVALGDTAARAALGIAELIFWIGLLVLFVPIAARLFWSGVSGRERFLLVAVLGLAMYGVKYLHSPLYFSFVDEFMHWRTASDILTSHHLFHGNSLLPVSPLYPSLEMVTSALTSLSGLSLFSAGVLMLVAARLILVLALYLFYEQVSGSARVAGIGTLLYMTNPNFLFFDAQFSYESFALPIALFVLFILARRPSSPISHRLGLSLALLPAILMVATTHHLTSYALAAFLLLWTATTALCAGSLRTAFLQGPGGAALLLIVTALLWLVFVATVTIGYLAPNFMAALHELVGLISGESGARQLFRSPNTGHFSPVWERVVGLGAVVCVLLGLPGGVLRIWRSHRINAAAAALAVATLAYPV
ncbi:MAG: rane protein, partial [Chloroflexi bacterium]|nr:rane protein [Chloroflexota bacterium]